MVNQPGAHDGDGLEPAVRVGRKPGHRAAVVQAPAVLAAKVLAYVAASQRGVRAHVSISGRVGVVVIRAKQKRIKRGPLLTQRQDAQDDVCI